ncbi:hypothetical protein H9Q72_014619, partial [Fusarium xylarioides]
CKFFTPTTPHKINNANLNRRQDVELAQRATGRRRSTTPAAYPDWLQLM